MLVRPLCPVVGSEVSRQPPAVSFFGVCLSCRHSSPKVMGFLATNRGRGTRVRCLLRGSSHSRDAAWLPGSLSGCITVHLFFFFFFNCFRSFHLLSLFKNFYLFIFLFGCTGCLMCKLSLGAASRGYSLAAVCGFVTEVASLVVELGLRSKGSEALAHRLSCSVACGIFPGQGLNPCLLHWQADSYSPCHRRSPTVHFLTVPGPLIPFIGVDS